MDRERRVKKPSKDQLQRAARIKSETKEDLEGLQQAYNESVQKLNVRDGISADHVIAAAEKINRHASRLKTNMAFPKSEKVDVKQIEIAGDKRKQLHELCMRLYELLTNPMIENPGVLDVEAAVAAEQLLDSIILLSDRAREN